MASKKLMGSLNSAIAREIQVSIQYMWQHIMVRGINADTLGDIFKKISIAEMKHAEEIAERVFYLGGVPTHQPMPINIGNTAKEMLRIDKKQEEEAIALYREIITIAEKERKVILLQPAFLLIFLQKRKNIIITSRNCLPIDELVQSSSTAAKFSLDAPQSGHFSGGSPHWPRQL